MFGQPGLDHRCLVGAVVVHDQVREGEAGKRWDTARMTALNEVLGLGPLWQSDNAAARDRAAQFLAQGEVFAFGKTHGVDIYLWSCAVLRTSGRGQGASQDSSDLGCGHGTALLTRTHGGRHTGGRERRDLSDLRRTAVSLRGSCHLLMHKRELRNGARTDHSPVSRPHSACAAGAKASSGYTTNELTTPAAARTCRGIRPVRRAGWSR